MARKFENKSGFLVLEMTTDEAKSIGFGIPGAGCVCMDCNDIIKDKLYYVAVLNDCMCEKCFQEFITSALYYAEDAWIEKQRYEQTLALLEQVKESGQPIHPQFTKIIPFNFN